VTGDLSFVVLGRPQGKGSKRVLPIRGKPKAGGQSVVLVDSNKNARPWANRVSAAALDAVEATPDQLPALVRGPVAVTFVFYFARPRGHFGVGRNINRLRASAPAHMSTMPDVDKLVRCTLDALVGTLIKDDGQVCALHAGKRYGEPERAEIRMRVLA
jgi:Holliday junction resolvase RusA-like endonuclease